MLHIVNTDTSSRAPQRLSERVEATLRYPLGIIAALCPAICGVGATVASFEPDGVVQGWVLARGGADLILTTILMVGAPLAAIISLISGVPWRPRGAAVLTKFPGSQHDRHRAVVARPFAAEPLAERRVTPGIGTGHGR